MRIALIGAGSWTVKTAVLLIERGHEVILIESDGAKIDALRDELDCGFLQGDGSSPEILREADPEATDMLYCITDNDQINIIASLVGRSLGFRRVVTSIESPEFVPICRELGLTDTLVPSQTVSRYLADMAMGIDTIELSTAVRGEARLFSFTVTKESAGSVADLDLPSGARLVWYYRQDEFHLADADTKLQVDDEVVIATQSTNLDALRKRWNRKESKESSD